MSVNKKLDEMFQLDLEPIKLVKDGEEEIKDKNEKKEEEEEDNDDGKEKEEKEEKYSNILNLPKEDYDVITVSINDILVKTDEERTDEEKEFLDEYKEVTSVLQEELNNFKVDDILNVFTENKIVDSLDSLGTTKQEKLTNLNTKISELKTTAVNEYLENKDENIKNLLTYVDDGGDLDSYIKARGTIDYSKLDIEDERIQKWAVRQHKLLTGEKEEEIEEDIELLEENGKLNKKAETAKKYLIDYQKKLQDALFEKQKLEREEYEKESKKEKDELVKNITEATEIAGFKPTKIILDKMIDLVSIEDNEGETTYDKLVQNPEIKKKIAYFLATDFKFDKLKKDIKSMTVAEIRKKLPKTLDSSKEETKGKKKGKEEEGEYLDAQSFLNKL